MMKQGNKGNLSLIPIYLVCKVSI